MDCLSLESEGEYNCTTIWGENCINKLGFDFISLWKITQQIQRYCPTDHRLQLLDNTPATPENAALTGNSCRAIAGSAWRYYPAADIWSRVTTWKFPLLQLIASSPRPPLGFAVEGFVICHLLGDPIGTIRDLLRVISNCQERADFWRTHLTQRESRRGSLDSTQKEHAWKAFAIITISYDEWGKGEEVQRTLQSSLHMLLASKANDLNTFLQLCNMTADSLAADRATKFLPIIVAQCLFVATISIGMVKVASNTSSTSFFVNIEVHGMAFSALFFWILPAVFLTSVIGVSQTQNAIPRILRRFQDDLDQQLYHAQITFPNEVLQEEQTRIVNGGIYCWQPEREESKSLLSLLQRNVLPLGIVMAGTVTAWLVSASVPPDGWEQRLCAEGMIFLTWLLSFSITCLLKLRTSSPSYNDRGRFWLTFAKDILATIATIGGIGVTLVGIFHNCDAYSRWNRTGLALPGQPDTAKILAHRIRTVYPALVFTSIGLQMFVIPVIVLIWYRHAFLVFLQRDENSSLDTMHHTWIDRYSRKLSKI